MTLVAAFSYLGYPMMIGDSLLSREGAIPGEPPMVDMNFTGIVPRDLGGGFIAGQRQKISLVSERLAVGWSGAEEGGVDFIKDLKNAFPDSEITLGSLMRFIDSTNFEAYTRYGHKLSVICMFLKDDGYEIIPHNNVTVDLCLPDLSQVCTIGSGLVHFREKSDMIVQQFSWEEGMEPYDRFIGFGHNLIGNFFNDQETFKTYYGGEFEIVYVSLKDGRRVFEKMKDFSIIFLDFYRDKNVLYFQPNPKILAQFYGEDGYLFTLRKILTSDAIGQRELAEEDGLKSQLSAVAPIEAGHNPPPPTFNMANLPIEPTQHYINMVRIFDPVKWRNEQGIVVDAHKIIALGPIVRPSHGEVKSYVDESGDHHMRGSLSYVFSIGEVAKNMYPPTKDCEIAIPRSNKAT